jgi:hypothetical protein
MTTTIKKFLKTKNMKKILMALTMIGFTWLSADAQVTATQSCGIVSKGKVCKGTTKTGAHCYKTAYAQNYKVCKSNYGYFICCETPNATNSTFPFAALQRRTSTSPMMRYEQPSAQVDRAPVASNRAPQSQSYPTPTTFDINGSSTYHGFYPSRNRIKVCYGGDNVAEQNRAAYQGCPTPAYDGPDRNKERNINESNANANLAPITGRTHE